MGLGRRRRRRRRRFLRLRRFRHASRWRDSRGGCHHMVHLRGCLHMVHLCGCPFTVRLVAFLHHVFDGDVGREAQGAVAEIHGVAQSHNAAHDGPGHPFMFFGGSLERFAHGDHFAGGFAASDGPGVRGAHHHALQHGLSADQRFFPAFQGGQKLHGGEESQVISQCTHDYLDAPHSHTTHLLGYHRLGVV